MTLGLGTAFAGPIYNYTFTGANSAGAYTATVSLNTSGGQAISGTGSLTGVGFTGPQSLTLVTLSSPGVEIEGGGFLGYRSNDGTDWTGADTAVPIDTSGLIFALGGPVGFGTSQQFDVYDAGGGVFNAGFFGKAIPGSAPTFWEYNQPVSVSYTVNAVPEPATWAMLLTGLVGFGFMMRRGRRKQAVA